MTATFAPGTQVEKPSSSHASYFDDHANFFVSSDVSVNHLLYKTTFTSSAVTELDSDETATTFGPNVLPVMDHILKEALALPLGTISDRHIPQPKRRPIMNSARDKWSHVSFNDKGAVQFHSKLSTDVLQLRLAWQQCNTKCEMPDCVPDDALQYFAPRPEFGLAWEMFDAGVHCDHKTLEAVVDRRNREAALEHEKEKLLHIALAGRSGGHSGNLLQHQSPSGESDPVASPARTGKDPQSAVAAAALTVDGTRGWEEEAEMDEEQLMSFYEPDVRQEAKEYSKKEYNFFVPPERWRVRRARNLEIAQQKAEQWHPLKLKAYQRKEDTNRSHATSIPALIPYFSCGIDDIDPYEPAPSHDQRQTKSSLTWGDVMTASL
jgi:hypothetical protein